MLGVPYLAAKYYEEGLDMTGTWEISLKIDGIRYIRNKDRVPCTRQGTPALSHVAVTMPQHMDDCELFRKDWSTSMSLKAGTIDVCSTDWYSLYPTDDRLIINREAVNPTHEQIVELLRNVLKAGHEGLVFKSNNIWVKVVPTRTVDVRITGWYEGNGRLKGTLGGFTTNYGKVGGGFSDDQRHAIWNVIMKNPKDVAGKIIECQYREKTTGNKMRMPVFIRFRFDKDTESFDLPYNFDEVLRV